MKKRIIVLVIALLSVALLFAACSSIELMSRDRADSANMEAQWDARNESGYIALHSNRRLTTTYGLREESDDAIDYTAGGDAPDQPQDMETDGRMRIRDVSARVETRQFDDYLAALQARATALGGYVQHINVEDWHTRSADVTLRIPATNLDDFTEALSEDAHVTNMRESVRDVTLQHNDMQAELEALRTERDALLRLMESAGDLGDLLSVQNALTRVRHQITRLEGEMRLLTNQVSYSTVSLTIREVERIVDEEAGFWASLASDFRESISGVGRGIANIFAGIIIALPYVVAIGAAVLLVVWLVLRKIKKRRNAKRQAQIQEGT